MFIFIYDSYIQILNPGTPPHCRSSTKLMSPACSRRAVLLCLNILYKSSKGGVGGLSNPSSGPAVEVEVELHANIHDVFASH